MFSSPAPTQVWLYSPMVPGVAVLEPCCSPKDLLCVQGSHEIREAKEVWNAEDSKHYSGLCWVKLSLLPLLLTGESPVLWKEMWRTQWLFATHTFLLSPVKTVDCSGKKMLCLLSARRDLGRFLLSWLPKKYKILCPDKDRGFVQHVQGLKSKDVLCLFPWSAWPTEANEAQVMDLVWSLQLGITAAGNSRLLRPVPPESLAQTLCKDMAWRSCGFCHAGIHPEAQDIRLSLLCAQVQWRIGTTHLLPFCAFPWHINRQRKLSDWGKGWEGTQGSRKDNMLSSCFEKLFSCQNRNHLKPKGISRVHC